MIKFKTCVVVIVIITTLYKYRCMIFKYDINARMIFMFNIHVWVDHLYATMSCSLSATLLLDGYDNIIFVMNKWVNIFIYNYECQVIFLIGWSLLHMKRISRNIMCTHPHNTITLLTLCDMSSSDIFCDSSNSSYQLWLLILPTP